ncbi:MAG: AgmX/PglI C-terminal domain-containing protein [Deltaproteobacteria bacterium]|nr:AgmX/PglI C-terminal domain-containing protein [Deltaproteobacteria bacterium]
MRIRGALYLVLLAAFDLSCGGVGATPDAKLGDTPSKGPVGKTIRSNSEKFLICARDAVSIQTGTAQELKLHFQVSGDGRVGKARIDSMSTPDPDLQVCVLNQLRKLQFPAPSDHQPKEVRYPLVLKPEN